MSEAPQVPDPGPQTTHEEWDEAGFPVEEVRELFVTFGKALRAFQLYDENNPVYQRFVSSLREAFRHLWDEMDRLSLAVQEEGLLCHGVEVYRESNRAESLAFLFYKDGIREATLLPGVEETELEPLLKVIQRARNLRKDEDDLLTILWEADLDYFRYTYVDILAEGVEMPEGGDGADPDQLQAVLDGEMGDLSEEGEVGEEGEDTGDEKGKEAQARPSGAVSRDDFNPAQYSLDPRELEKLHREAEEEMARDLRTDVLNALLDRLEEPGNPERQLEILSILRTLLPNFLSHGALRSAARVLEELQSLSDREEIFNEACRDRVSKLLDEVSTPATVEELVRTLEDGTVDASGTELAAFLEHLRAGAVEPLLRASELTEVKELQPVLREAVHGIARSNRDAVLDLLDSSDPVVVAASVRLVGRMQVHESARTVARLMGHRDASVRLASVEAARDLKSPSTTSALPGALSDPDREVRIAAARALADLGFTPAAPRFRKLIESKDIRQADITEKVAIFESYGRLGDEKATALLDGLLNGTGFLGRKEPPEIRAAAALGLGKVGTPEAQEALERATGERDPVIRSAVSRALKGEDEEAS